MKTKRFQLLTVLLAAVMMLALSVNVMAVKSNAVTKDGLTAQLITDKDLYKAGESVKATVQVDNHTGEKVYVITKITAPDGVVLENANVAFDAFLENGESWEAVGGVVTSIGNVAGATATAGSTTATGDNMQAGFWVLLTALAVCGLFALFVYGKNRTTWLSIMLCIAMVGGMVVAAVPAHAADIEGSISLSCTIQVDGKDEVVSATVSYMSYEEDVEDTDDTAEVATPSEPSEESSESSEDVDSSDASDSSSEESSEPESSEDSTEPSTDASDENSEPDSSEGDTGSEGGTGEDSGTGEGGTGEDSGTGDEGGTGEDSGTGDEGGTGDTGNEPPIEGNNLINNDYTNHNNNGLNSNANWIYEVKYNASSTTGGADANVEHLTTDGYSVEDGCIYYDITNSGTKSNNFQIKYLLQGDNIVKEGHVYKVGFRAKLVDNDNSENEKSIKVSTCKLRDKDINNAYSDVLSFNILEGEGDWTIYEYEFTVSATLDEALLAYQFGGCQTENVKLYLDDFYLIDTEHEAAVTIKLNDNINAANVITACDTSESGDAINFYAASNVESGLIFDSWSDEYGNKVSADSYYSCKLYSDAEYVANFREYTYTAKNFSVPVSEEFLLTVTEPVINNGEVSSTATVVVPTGWIVEDCGLIFYPGYWTENFNVFSENIENVSVNTVTEGIFSATAAIETKYGVLARAYAIAKNTDGKIVIQYSDSAYTADANAPEKASYKTVNYVEALGLFTKSDVHSPEEHAKFVEEAALTECDMISFCPTMWKMNCWNSEVDGFWSEYATTEGEKSLSYYEECKDYVLAGGDPVGDVVNACKEKNIAVFIDYRMNDNHYNSNLEWPTHTPFWKNNPKYWINDSERTFNYMFTEVQDYYYAILEELLTTYDVNGVNLDLDRYRSLFCIEDVERGAAVFTEFIGRVKELINKISIDKGRDIQLAVRIPQTVETVNSLGMDFSTWDEREYLDILYVGTHYDQTQEPDIEGFVESVTNADVIGLVHYLTKQVDSSNRRYITKEVAYAAAKSYFERGASGVFWWNMQYLGDKSVREEFYRDVALVNSDEELAKVEKNYVLTSTDLSSTRGEEQGVSIYINENMEYFKTAILRVEAQKVFSEETSISVKVNDVELSEISRNNTELFEALDDNGAYPSKEQLKFYEVPLTAFKQGWNDIEIKNISGYGISGYINGIEIALYNEEPEDPEVPEEPKPSDGNLITKSFDTSSAWYYGVKGSSNYGAVANASVELLAEQGTSKDDGCIHYDITNSGAISNALEVIYKSIDLSDFENSAIPAGTYKVGFKAKLVEKTPDNATEQTLKVNTCKLRDSSSNNTVYSDVVKLDISEGTGDWVQYEGILNVTADQATASAGKTVWLTFQMGGDSKENLHLYMDDFFLIPFDGNLITQSFDTSSAWYYGVKGSSNHGAVANASVELLAEQGTSTDDGCIHYDITNSGAISNALEVIYKSIDLSDFENSAIPAGTYKVGFKAKLVEKTPDNETEQTLKVNTCKLRDSSSNNTVYSDVVKLDISEGTGDWVQYEGTLTVTVDQATASAGKTVWLTFQMGGDSKENLHLYMDDFFLIPTME